MKLKSLDLASFAHVKKTPVKRWEMIGKRKRGAKKEPVLKVAILSPRPGKGFEFEGGIFPKVADVLPILKEKGFDSYRISAVCYKKNGAFNPTVSIAA